MIHFRGYVLAESVRRDTIWIFESILFAQTKFNSGLACQCAIDEYTAQNSASMVEERYIAHTTNTGSLYHGFGL